MIGRTSRHRTKPINAPTSSAASSRNLKLICRFNGAFLTKPQSVKNTRYIGGETRIISVDRNIDFSKLHFRISQLCPNLRPFSLKYQLPISGSRLGSESNHDDSPLVSMVSDEDVLCMIEEYDRLELHGKQTRLWVYVCTGGSDNGYDAWHGITTANDSLRKMLRHELLLAKQRPLLPIDGNVNVKTKTIGLMDCLLGEFTNLNDLHNLRVSLICDRVDGNKNLNRENSLAWSMGYSNNGIRNHRNCSNRHFNHYQSGRLDDRVVSEGKFFHGLRPKSHISKQGQSSRSYYCSSSNKSWLAGNSREKSHSPVSSFENSKPKNCHLACSSAGGGVVLGTESIFNCNAVESPSSFVENRKCQRDLLTSTPYNPHQIPLINDCEKDCVASVSDVLFTFSHHKVVSKSSNDPSVECNKGLIDIEGTSDLLVHSKNGSHDLETGVTSSVELLDNLSLSSKGLEPPTPSIASTDVASSLLKAKNLDPLDTNISTVFKAGKANAFRSNCCTLNATGMAEIEEGGKCSNVMGGISDDLATRPLQTIENSDLEHIKVLGSGAYGTVYHGKWKGSDVAIKRIKPSCFTKDTLTKDRLVEDFWKEAHILGQLHHPNIVAFYGVVTDGPANNLGTVTEYMVNGSLKQVLRKKDRTIDRRKRIILAMDAAFGMEYLHGKNIVHFDLKSPNLLVNMKDLQKPVCKIGDLGLSKIKKRTLVSGGVRGTIPWMAPELLNSNNKMVTEKVDVYSFGIIMWELLTGEEPYADLCSEEIIAGIIKGTLRPGVPSWCDPAWRSLMERCWSSDPKSRPAFSEIAKELRTMASGMNIR